MNSSFQIGVFGLGYVGLPLTIEFSKHYTTIGFDTDNLRITELAAGIDRTGEVDNSTLRNLDLRFTGDLKDLIECNIFIVTVPTPINEFKSPDLKALKKCTEMIGSILKKRDIVIYESTVFPGCTEEFCVPILEHTSSLKYNLDFFCGYSPERINPGDKETSLTTIKKITSGSNEKTSILVDNLYKTIIKAGTFRASNIKIAEAAKSIENAQRDINISFINEISVIFDRMNIDTYEVLEAAKTKWNFLNFKPGLVGGHCIGVDPYYLAYQAQTLGYIPELILGARKINENMAHFVAQKMIKMMIKNDLPIKNSKLLILGITFKENCPDIRNSKIVDVVQELENFGAIVDVYDPIANWEEVKSEFNLQLISKLAYNYYHGIILAVGHKAFTDLNVQKLKQNVNSVIFDLKAFYPKGDVTARL